MKRLQSILLQTALLCGLPLSINAQSIELQAISDFTNLDSGEVPYYLDIAGGRNVLAINAADPAHRNKFARAEHEFTGSDGIYDITINALGEIDGDGTYRLVINGVIQGVSVNDPVSSDYVVIEHRFQGIALTTLDTIAVESNAVSNDTIPEGDGFAFARGRWKSVSLDVFDAGEVVVDASVELGLSLSTIDSHAQHGGQAPFIVSVINNSPSNTATAPVVDFSLPEEITFNYSDTCTRSQSTVRCLLPNLAPFEVSSVSFIGDIHASGWLGLSASVSADQPDNDRANNTANLSFESQTASPVVMTQPEPEAAEPSDTNSGGDNSVMEASTETSTEASSETGENAATSATNNTAGAMGNSKSGVTGITALMILILFFVFRVARPQTGPPRS